MTLIIKKTPKAGTSERAVLEYLKTGHTLDAAKATHLFGYIRLSSAIRKLRLKGWPVVTTVVKTGDKDMTLYSLPSHIRSKVGHGRVHEVLGVYAMAEGEVQIRLQGKYFGFCPPFSSVEAA